MLVLVGESPGMNELRDGVPFTGPSGQVLERELLPQFQGEDTPLMLNAMQCLPRKAKKGRDQSVMAPAIHACHPRLIQQIKEYPRKLVVAMGNPAMWSLTGDYSLKITRARGLLIESDLAEYGILPVLHPAALLRGTGSYRQFKEDMAYAQELVLTDQKKEPPPFKYTEITSDKQAQWIVHKLLARAKRAAKYEPPVWTADIETTGFDPRVDAIITIGITAGDGHVYCFLGRHIQTLRPLLESPYVRWNWHNGKFDTAFLIANQVAGRVDEDTLLLNYALDENPGVHDLETIANDVLGAPDYKDMLKPHIPKGGNYADVPLPVLNKYMALDVSNTHHIFQHLRARVALEDPLEKLYTQTLLPASDALRQVEAWGFHVDREYTEGLDVEFEEKVFQLEQQCQEAAGYPINPNSPQQISVHLFQELGLPNKRKGSTDKKVLEELPQVPFVKLLREHRKVKKLHSTYVRAVLRNHIKDDGRVHCTFLIHGARTGRLASRKPNLQNIPRDPRLRGMYIATPGYVIVEVDLKQAELTSLAQLSRDPGLVEIYQTGKDLHTELAIFLFGKNFTKEQRVRCKNVNFGIVYGVTANGLQEQIHLPPAECQAMIDGWYKRFPVAGEFIKACRRAPARGQIITTVFGRKKRVGLVTRENLRDLQNESANFPHQSIASDITLHATIRCVPQLREWGVRVVDIVHDSIITEVPENHALVADTAKLLSSTLSQVPIDWGLRRVPFRADINVGHRWGALKEVTLEELAQHAA